MRLSNRRYIRTVIALATGTVMSSLAAILLASSMRPLALACGVLACILVLALLGLYFYDQKPVQFTDERYERFIGKTVRSALGRHARVAPGFAETATVEDMQPGEWGWMAQSDILFCMRPGSYYINPASVILTRPTPVYSTLVYRDSAGGQMRCIMMGVNYGMRAATWDDDFLPTSLHKADPVPAWTIG